jgi:hypothetical protein
MYTQSIPRVEEVKSQTTSGVAKIHASAGVTA